MKNLLITRRGQILTALIGSGLLLTLMLAIVTSDQPPTQVNGPLPTQVNYPGYLTGYGGIPGTTEYKNVIVVAKSGGDYQTINEAMMAAEFGRHKPALIWVAPGVYNESVTVGPDVHLMGAGQRFTVIRSDTACLVGSTPTTATIVMKGSSRLSGLDIRNTCGPAVLVYDGEPRTVLDDLHLSGCTYTVYITGGATGPLIQNSLIVGDGISSTLFYLDNNAPRLRALTGWTDNKSKNGYGIYLASGSGGDVRDIYFAVNGTEHAYGIYNDNSNITLRNSRITSRIFTDVADAAVAAFYNTGISATLNVHNVLATAQVYGDSGNSYGLDNNDGATAFLYHSVLTARGGSLTRGIRNGDYTTLETESVTVLAEEAKRNNGLENWGDALLHGGSFTARGGVRAAGIYNNTGSDTMLTVEGATALAEGADASNLGIDVQYGTVALRCATSIGGGTSGARVGLHVGETVLTADSSQFVGETYALQMEAPSTVYLAVSLVDGEIITNSGTLNCFQAYDESYIAACP